MTTMIQYANLHFNSDAMVEVERVSDSPLDADETYISIRTKHMNVSFHLADDEVEGWLTKWNKLDVGWSTYVYNDTHLSPSFTAFITGGLFDKLRGKVLDHVAYTKEVKV